MRKHEYWLSAVLLWMLAVPAAAATILSVPRRAEIAGQVWLCFDASLSTTWVKVVAPGTPEQQFYAGSYCFTAMQGTVKRCRVPTFTTSNPTARDLWRTVSAFDGIGYSAAVPEAKVTCTELPLGCPKGGCPCFAWIIEPGVGHPCARDQESACTPGQDPTPTGLTAEAP